MDEDPFSPWGLRPVELSDAHALGRYFASLAEPLSDYTFSQLFTWRNSLRILWKELRGHLCVFANGTGDLTLLLPPQLLELAAQCFGILGTRSGRHQHDGQPHDDDHESMHRTSPWIG